jgi:hypothetical protein
MPKGEKISKHKAKGPHHQFQKFINFNWYLEMTIFSIGIFKGRFSKLVSTKTLLKTKRRISFRGSFV